MIPRSGATPDPWVMEEAITAPPLKVGVDRLKTSFMSKRAIDHVVMPTADLQVARQRLEALGFTVAAEGLHPFGTNNACVYFSDDTFIEPLAVADAALADQSVSLGNVFVARDQRFREAHGSEGLSAIVMATDDADADHAAFMAAGVSAGARLDFSRGYIDADGTSRTVSFRLAFAAPADVRHSYFFTCERIDAPTGGRGALAEHANGVTGLAGVIVAAADPAATAKFFAILTGGAVQTMGGNAAVAPATGNIAIMTPVSLEEEFGVAPSTSSEPMALCGLALSVKNLAATAAYLKNNGIDFHHGNARIVVPPVPGQGAFLAFEEA